MLAPLIVAGAASAQQPPPDEAAPAPSTPRVSLAVEAALSMTATDNVRLARSREADLVSTASAGLRIGRSVGALRGFADYTLTGFVYANNGSANDVQHALNASGTAELIAGRFLVDLGASVSQQSASPLGTQTTSNVVIDGNRTEVGAASVSPYLRGRLLGRADYLARITRTLARARDTDAGDTDTTETLLQIGEAAAPRGAGWSLTGSRQVVDFSAGRRTEDDRLEGTLSYAPNGEWRLTAIAGREANDFESVDRQTHGFGGLRVEWSPSRVTALSAERRNRFFGSSYEVDASHRMARLVLSIGATREIGTSVGQPAPGTSGIPAFDLLFQQLASSQPDPVLRSVQVNELLRRFGIDPTDTLLATALASAVTLQRSIRVGAAYVGTRDTLTLGLLSTRSRRLDSIASVIDPFAGGNEIAQKALTLEAAHRLTPLSSVSVAGTWLRSTGSVGDQRTSLKSALATFATRLGRRTGLAVGLRAARFESPAQPYTEHALYGSMTVQF